MSQPAAVTVDSAEPCKGGALCCFASLMLFVRQASPRSKFKNCCRQTQKSPAGVPQPSSSRLWNQGCFLVWEVYLCSTRCNLSDIVCTCSRCEFRSPFVQDLPGRDGPARDYPHSPFPLYRCARNSQPRSVTRMQQLPPCSCRLTISTRRVEVAHTRTVFFICQPVGAVRY